MAQEIRRLVGQHIRGRQPYLSFERNFFYRTRRVLGRHACLGAEVLGRFQDAQSTNFQKNRVDHVLRHRAAQAPSNLLLNSLVQGWSVRAYVQQQRKDLLAMKNSQLIVLDSFSELADQKFGWGGSEFYCCYGDLSTSAKGSPELISHGLLNSDLLESLYDELFFELKANSPDAKIVFLNFPTIKEKRKKFVDRGNFIREVVDRLCSRHPDLRSYSISNKEAAILNRKDSDSFAYHYSDNVYREFAGRIISDIEWLSLK